MLILIFLCFRQSLAFFEIDYDCYEFGKVVTLKRRVVGVSGPERITPLRGRVEINESSLNRGCLGSYNLVDPHLVFEQDGEHLLVTNTAPNEPTVPVYIEEPPAIPGAKALFRMVKEVGSIGLSKKRRRVLQPGESALLLDRTLVVIDLGHYRYLHLRPFNTIPKPVLEIPENKKFILPVQNPPQTIPFEITVDGRSLIKEIFETRFQNFIRFSVSLTLGDLSIPRSSGGFTIELYDPIVSETSRSTEKDPVMLVRFESDVHPFSLIMENCGLLEIDKYGNPMMGTRASVEIVRINPQCFAQESVIKLIVKQQRFERVVLIKASKNLDLSAKTAKKVLTLQTHDSDEEQDSSDEDWFSNRVFKALEDLMG